jgi:putative Mg2+ transporter-C (MgtC) family protein
MDILFGTDAITYPVAAFRLFLSFIAGGLVGFERARRRQSAGLRTHILICLGSTFLMLLSIWVPAEFLGMKNGDPGRIAAQVVSGIGFLGAGSIIRLGNTIKGLTTAASLWFIAAIGLGLGAGMYVPCVIALGLGLFSLVVLDPVERFFFPAERIKHLVITYTGHSGLPEKVRKFLEEADFTVQSVDVEKNMKKDESEVRFLLRVPVEADLDALYGRIKEVGGVEKVELREKF